MLFFIWFVGNKLIILRGCSVFDCLSLLSIVLVLVNKFLVCLLIILFLRICGYLFVIDYVMK